MKTLWSGSWRHTCIAVCGAIAALLVTERPAAAQDTFTFDWRVVGTVTRAVQASDKDSTTRHQRSGTSVLTLVRDPSPDVRFAFDFVGLDGGGSGLIPRVAEEALDPNFAYPSPLPPGLPPAEARLVRGSFPRLAEGRIPPAFDIVYSESFVCRAPLPACGNVTSWEVTFIGHARATSRPPR